MSDYKCLINCAVDFSRLQPNQYALLKLRKLIQLGKEIDLLESLRRSEKNIQLKIDTVMMHSAKIEIDPILVETVILESFHNNKMIEIQNDSIKLLFDDTVQIYQYGQKRFNEIVSEDEKQIAEIVCRATRRGVPLDDLDKALQYFSEIFRSGLKAFLIDNNLLTSFEHKGVSYLISPRIYKDEKKFKEVKEILEDNKFDQLINFLEENPGNPLPVVEKHLGVDVNVLSALSKSGIIDPVRLNVQGDAKEYLYLSNLLKSRNNQDNFDLVKKTLANFRFGEYYSKKTRLYDLDRFFGYMLDHGYAGSAEAIGTDYMDLEWSGVFRIEPIEGTDKFRFWMLKRDVIEDARSILRGFIPIQSDLSTINITDIDNVIQTRANLRNSFTIAHLSDLTKALRQIEDGLSES